MFSSFLPCQFSPLCCCSCVTFFFFFLKIWTYLHTRMCIWVFLIPQGKSGRTSFCQVSAIHVRASDWCSNTNDSQVGSLLCKKFIHSFIHSLSMTGFWFCVALKSSLPGIHLNFKILGKWHGLPHYRNTRTPFLVTNLHTHKSAYSRSEILGIRT